MESGFEAGHRRGPAGEELPLHHHEWKVAVRVRSEELDHIGIVVDFRLVRAALDEVLAELDQRVLEEVEALGDMEPTAPALAQWIFERLTMPLRHVRSGVEHTEPDRSHDYWLEAVEVEADAGLRFEYRPAAGGGREGPSRGPAASRTKG